MQQTNINDIMDATLEQLWPLAIENGWDRTNLSDIVTSLSYVCRNKTTIFKITKINNIMN